MSTMNDDELRRLLAEATPGPWVADTVVHDGCVVWGPGDDELLANVGATGLGNQVAFDVVQPANCELMAASRDLAAEVLRLREALRLAAAYASNGGSYSCCRIVLLCDGALSTADARPVVMDKGEK